MMSKQNLDLREVILLQVMKGFWSLACAELQMSFMNNVTV